MNPIYKVQYLLIFIWLLLQNDKGIDPHSIKSSKKGFVVLELFTSQGCSSCPPADEILNEYALLDQAEIIPLAYHVDYWNYLGWKDPFSNKECTDRQKAYAKLLQTNLYTPQLVINGEREFVGSSRLEIANAIKKELKYTANRSTFIDLNQIDCIDNRMLKIKYTTSLKENCNVILILVQKKGFSEIKRGENRGLQQTNYAIVTNFTSKTLKNKTDTVFLEFTSKNKRSDFKVVALIQNMNTGQVIASDQKEID